MFFICATVCLCFQPSPLLITLNWHVITNNSSNTSKTIHNTTNKNNKIQKKKQLRNTKQQQSKTKNYLALPVSRNWGHCFVHSASQLGGWHGATVARAGAGGGRGRRRRRGRLTGSGGEHSPVTVCCVGSAPSVNRGRELQMVSIAMSGADCRRWVESRNRSWWWELAGDASLGGAQSRVPRRHGRRSCVISWFVPSARIVHFEKVH